MIFLTSEFFPRMESAPEFRSARVADDWLEPVSKHPITSGKTNPIRWANAAHAPRPDGLTVSDGHPLNTVFTMV